MDSVLIGLFGLSLGLCILGASFLLRSTTKVKVVSEQEVGGKTYYAVRIEGQDFLFFKHKENVEFLNALDNVEDFKEVNLEDFKKRKELEKEAEDTLSIPKYEKAS